MLRRVTGKNVAKAIEVVYEVDQPDERWLPRLAAAIATIVDQGSGALAYRYGVRNGGIALESPVFLANVDPSGAALHKVYSERLARGELAALFAKFTPQAIERCMLRPLGPGPFWPLVARAMHPEDAGEAPLLLPDDTPDLLGLTAPDGRGEGLIVGAPFTKLRAGFRAQERALSQLLPCLQAAQRLRYHVQGIGRESSEEAILEPDGRLVDASGAARPGKSREALSQAAKWLDKRRAALHGGGDWDGEPVWPGLIEGRWSLIERFDSDGRRFLVAHANAPGVHNPRCLTQREREVAEWVASGCLHKETAAELGCTESTVATTIEQVLSKLGLRSRLELILDYRRAPRALAHFIGELVPEQPIVALQFDPEPTFPPGLTAAQREVAQLVVQGYSNHKIAEARGTSPRTVANQVRAIFVRCGVHTREQLMIAMIPRGSHGQGTVTNAATPVEEDGEKC